MIQEVCEIGDISGRDTPVPIPNTAVKPARADGTNTQLGVGRVGRRRSHQPLESPREEQSRSPSRDLVLDTGVRGPSGRGADLGLDRASVVERLFEIPGLLPGCRRPEPQFLGQQFRRLHRGTAQRRRRVPMQ